MTFANNTPFAAEAIPFFAPDGREVVLVIMKATFARVERRALRAETQMPVRLTDVPHLPEETGFAPNGPFLRAPDGDRGPPVEVSLKYASDVCTSKRGMDVVLVAEAVSVKRTLAADVAISLGAKKLTLRVHGERVYDRAIGKLSFGPAAAFERRPLVWELAYGGTSDDFSAVERHNPVGRGVASGELAGRPAPCIEDPAAPLVPGSASAPVGVGAIATSWLPRSKHAGTYDTAWHEHRMPLSPADYDVRAGNVAAPALVLEQPLAPGELCATMGLVPEGLWSFDVPRLAFTVRARTADGRALKATPTPDTLLLEPAKDRIELVARVVFPMGRGKSLLREVQVDHDG